MQEQIRPVIIDGEDTGWKASNLGYLITTGNKATIGAKTKDGYRKVQICGKHYRLHRIIALTFLNKPIANPDGRPFKGRVIVHHKNGDKEDNNISNLEWCDKSYNMKEWAKSRPGDNCTQVYKCLETGAVGTSKWFAKNYGIKVASLRSSTMSPTRTINGLHFERIGGHNEH